GAAGDVEHQCSRGDSEPLEKLLRALFEIAGKNVIVAGHPGRLQASLQLFKIVGRLCRHRRHTQSPCNTCTLHSVVGSQNRSNAFLSACTLENPRPDAASSMPPN